MPVFRHVLPELPTDLLSQLLDWIICLHDLSYLQPLPTKWIMEAHPLFRSHNAPVAILSQVVILLSERRGSNFSERDVEG